jgi:hypothetical protein
MTTVLEFKGCAACGFLMTILGNAPDANGRRGAKR